MPEAAPVSSSFPSLGVSLRFLRRIRDDPRLQQPVCSLPFVSVSGTFVPTGTLAPARQPGELSLSELRALAQEYRVFSNLDGAPEFDRYSDQIKLTREKWLTVLSLPAATTSQVCVVVAKVDTLLAQTSYAEMLRASGGSAAEDVGPANVFLSHAWRYNFDDLVDAVEAHYLSQPDYVGASTFIWNDIFVENQNNSASKPPDYFFHAFKDAVGAIGHTLLVLLPWRQPIPLSRAWCVWEIFSTISTGAKISIALSPSERESFEAALVSDFESLHVALSNIDAEEAQAFDVRDKERIDATIQTELGGFAPVNELVTAHLRRWLAGVGQAALDRMRVDEGDAAADSSALLNNLALLLRRIPSREGGSDRDQTESLQRAALAAITEQLHQLTGAAGEDMAADEGVRTRWRQLRLEQAVRCCNLASVVRATDPGESFLLYKQAFDISEAVVKELVEETGGIDAAVFSQHALNTNNLAEAHYRMALNEDHPAGGDHFSISRRMFRQSIGYYTNISGGDAADTQRPVHNLGALLLSLPPVDRCLRGHQLVSGNTTADNQRACDVCDQPIETGCAVLQCLECEFDCCAMCAAGSAAHLDESEALLRKALLNRQNTMGKFYPDTLVTQGVLTAVLEKQAKAHRLSVLLASAPARPCSDDRQPQPKLQPEPSQPEQSADIMGIAHTARVERPTRVEAPLCCADTAIWSQPGAVLLEEATELCRDAVLGFRQTCGKWDAMTLTQAIQLVQLLALSGSWDQARSAAEMFILEEDNAPMDAVQCVFGRACSLVEAGPDQLAADEAQVAAALCFYRVARQCKMKYGADHQGTTSSIVNMRSCLQLLPHIPEAVVMDLDSKAENFFDVSN